MAMSGLGTAQHMGVRCRASCRSCPGTTPQLCELVHPTLTALRRDIAAAGAEGARRLLQLVEGSAVTDFEEPPPALVRRGSTGRPSRFA